MVRGLGRAFDVHHVAPRGPLAEDAVDHGELRESPLSRAALCFDASVRCVSSDIGHARTEWPEPEWDDLRLALGRISKLDEVDPGVASDAPGPPAVLRALGARLPPLILELLYSTRRGELVAMYLIDDSHVTGLAENPVTDGQKSGPSTQGGLDFGEDGSGDRDRPLFDDPAFGDLLGHDIRPGISPPAASPDEGYSKPRSIGHLESEQVALEVPDVAVRVQHVERLQTGQSARRVSAGEVLRTEPSIAAPHLRVGLAQHLIRYTPEALQRRSLERWSRRRGSRIGDFGKWCFCLRLLHLGRRCIRRGVESRCFWHGLGCRLRRVRGRATGNAEMKDEGQCEARWQHSIVLGPCRSHDLLKHDRA